MPVLQEGGGIFKVVCAAGRWHYRVSVVLLQEASDDEIPGSSCWIGREQNHVVLLLKETTCLSPSVAGGYRPLDVCS